PAEPPEAVVPLTGQARADKINYNKGKTSFHQNITITVSCQQGGPEGAPGGNIAVMAETSVSTATAVAEQKRRESRSWSPIPERLVRGRGRYVPNVTPSGTLHLAVVRSQHAHALLRRVDLT